MKIFSLKIDFKNPTLPAFGQAFDFPIGVAVKPAVFVCFYNTKWPYMLQNLGETRFPGDSALRSAATLWRGGNADFVAICGGCARLGYSWGALD